MLNILKKMILSSFFIYATHASSFIECIKKVDDQIEIKKRHLAEILDAEGVNHIYESGKIDRFDHRNTFCSQEIEEGMGYVRQEDFSYTQPLSIEKRLAVLSFISNMTIANMELADKNNFSIEPQVNEENVLPAVTVKIMINAVKNSVLWPGQTLEYGNFILNQKNLLVSRIKGEEAYKHADFKAYTDVNALKIIFPEDFFNDFYKKSFDYKGLPKDDSGRQISLIMALKHIQPKRSLGFYSECTFESISFDHGLYHLKRSDSNKLQAMYVDNTHSSARNLMAYFSTCVYFHPLLPSKISILYPAFTNGMDYIVIPFLLNPTESIKFIMADVSTYGNGSLKTVPIGLEETDNDCEEENWRMIDERTSVRFVPSLIKSLNQEFMVRKKLDYLGSFFYYMSFDFEKEEGIDCLSVSQAYAFYKFILTLKNSSLNIYTHLAQADVIEDYLKNIQLTKKPCFNAPKMRLILQKNALKWLENPIEACKKEWCYFPN